MIRVRSFCRRGAVLSSTPPRGGDEDSSSCAVCWENTLAHVEHRVLDKIKYEARFTF